MVSNITDGTARLLFPLMMNEWSCQSHNYQWDILVWDDLLWDDLWDNLL